MKLVNRKKDMILSILDNYFQSEETRNPVFIKCHFQGGSRP